MKTLRPYQSENAIKGIEVLNKLKIVYLAMEVRTGKTATALEIARLGDFKKVLFLTKKKAIDSIQSDYNDFGFTYPITIINNESLHTVLDYDYDLIISDEHHRNGAFPKPNAGTVELKNRYSHLPMIFLSGTPTPESYSQIFHQFWISRHSPFKENTFYKWFGNIQGVKGKISTTGAFKSNDYSLDPIKIKKTLTELELPSCIYQEVEDILLNQNKKVVDHIDEVKKPYFITYTQKEAGFNAEVTENILYVDMKPITYKIASALRKDNIFKGNTTDIIADTGSKLMSKLHQLYSGTVILEDENSVIIDNSKVEFIKQNFAGKKLAIFYKFKAELELLKNEFGETVCFDIDTFNSTDKHIALQIVSGREGISLAAADVLIYLNIDFSAVSYWQSRDRLTTADRLQNNVYWVFAKNGIEDNIYNAVQGKKNYTLSIFKKNYGIKVPG